VNKRIIIEFEKKVLITEIETSLRISQFISEFFFRKNRTDDGNYELYSFLHGHIASDKTFAELYVSDNEKFFLQKRFIAKQPVISNQILELPDIEFHFSEQTLKGRLASDTVIAQNDYELFSLGDIFKNTTVQNCSIKKQTLQALKLFCRKSIASGERIEYGGFLLGKIMQTNENQYNILIEQFVEPTVYDYQDEYRIDFGHKAMIELDAALQTYADCILVGWFHTHPGHTAFLSSYDLNIHNGSFTEFYQVAIVTDTFTPDFETGIFSRKSDGKINNQHDLKHFFKWTM